jgi:hypothetical protein
MKILGYIGLVGMMLVSPVLAADDALLQQNLDAKYRADLNIQPISNEVTMVLEGKTIRVTKISINPDGSIGITTKSGTRGIPSGDVRIDVIISGVSGINPKLIVGNPTDKLIPRAGVVRAPVLSEEALEQKSNIDEAKRIDEKFNRSVTHAPPPRIEQVKKVPLKEKKRITIRGE